MIRNGILLVVVALGLFIARADAQPRAHDCDLSCVFEKIWWEIETLDQKDRDRLEPEFLQTVAVTSNKELIDAWEQRLGLPAKPAGPFRNYALEKVTRFVDAHGWEAFFIRAELKQRPFKLRPA